VLVAIASFFIIQDFPETATFLTAEERAFVVYRLKYQGQVKGAEDTNPQVAQAEEFQWKYVKNAFSDWQIYVNIVVYWGVSYSMIVPWYAAETRRLFARFTEFRYFSLRFLRTASDIKVRQRN
jgi:hypothetical protein